MTMKCRPEDRLLFYASVSGHDDYIGREIVDIFSDGIDSEYLLQSALSFGVSGKLYERLSDAGVHDADVMGRMRSSMMDEMSRTASIKALYRDISVLLGDAGIDFIPLKGCDPRISAGARGFFNAMQDIDILVKLADVEELIRLFEAAGYCCQGVFSGSHVTFFTDDDSPQFIEVHWDLINRRNRIHSALFGAPIESIWERSVVEGQIRVLSYEDLLSYLAAHAVKEYFHRPKWMADIAWMVENCENMIDTRKSPDIIKEWGVSNALGYISYACETILPEGNFDALLNFGAAPPSGFRRFLGRRLVSYERLRRYRPLLFLSAATSFWQSVIVSTAIFGRMFRSGYD